ncbi:hypothetical protein PC120_g5676 [Phytophthora cactorum]|nr:hypothetical protein PC120_g5676 [Phytophthora cactorum]
MSHLDFQRALCLDFLIPEESPHAKPDGSPDLVSFAQLVGPLFTVCICRLIDQQETVGGVLILANI